MKNSIDLSNSSDWAPILVKEYGDGASDIEVCDALKISKKEFDRSYSQVPIFKELVDIGRLSMEAWWIRFGRKSLTDKNINTTLWMFNMKNRFGWAEKSETTTSAPMEQKTLDELRLEIAAKLPAILKRHGVPMKDADVVSIRPKKPESDILG